MSDASEIRHDEEDEAVQAVLDRVLSYQGGAPVETVRAELAAGLDQVGAERSEEWVQSHAETISRADPAQS